MKRKTIEKIAPVQPTRTGEYIITAQNFEDILILNVFYQGILRGRHALDPQTGEYSQYRAEGKDWKHWKFGTLLDLDVSMGGWYWTQDVIARMIFDTEEQENMVREALMAAKKINWKPNTYDLIDEAEKDYQRNQKEKTERNRRMRIQDKMNLVPALPEDIREWIWKQEGALEFAFYDKENAACYGTCCRQQSCEKEWKRTDGGKKIRHNDRALCPQCGKQVIVKKRVDRIETKTHFSLLQKIDHRMSVYRHFDVQMKWDSKGRKVYLNESVRMIFYHVSTLPKYSAEIFYNQYGTGGAWSGGKFDYEESYFDNKRNPSNRREFAGYLYPKGITEALEDTAYQVWGRVFSQMAAAGKKLNYNRLLCTQNHIELVNVVECLFKGRFHKLLEETTEKISYWSMDYFGCLYVRGECIEDVFAIQDRQLINRIREVDGGENTVKWMRWSEKYRKKISQETLEWLSREDIWPEDVQFIQERMNIQQVMNYVKRQQAEGYATRNAEGVLNQWKDYLSMCKNLGKKIDDEMMYRPRELKRRHDECVEEINRQRMLEDMKRNEKQRAEEARRMREKFPGAEDILQEITPKYEYSSTEYVITVPQTLMDIITEGQALHHCAGATDRYFDRILQRETYICFLRKTADPGTPYYTIEVEPGGTIRQHRGYLDEEPGIEQIKPFLREWQQVVKKRLNARDHEYAKISAVKRAENIEELKAKNNTRVLQGLMEDFMEAI